MTHTSSVVSPASMPALMFIHSQRAPLTAQEAEMIADPIHSGNLKAIVVPVPLLVKPQFVCTLWKQWVCYVYGLSTYALIMYELIL